MREGKNKKDISWEKRFAMGLSRGLTCLPFPMENLDEIVF